MANKTRTSTGWMVQQIHQQIKNNKKKIIDLTGKLNKAQYKKDINPISLAKETIKGLPAATVKVGKGALGIASKIGLGVMKMKKK